MDRSVLPRLALSQVACLDSLVGTMKITFNVVIALTALACLVALAISIYPGILNDLLFIGILLSFLVVPVVGIVGVIVFLVLAHKGKLRGLRIPWKHVAVVFALLFGTYVLLKFYVPRRIAFAASRAAFEQMVPQATPSEYQGTPLNRRLGVYKVDEYAADARGGVYFRVYSGSDGIGPDRMSYGFAYKPNQEGTPFGAARYRLFWLGNDWYWFCASDDWY
jgi:hypothetical protein